MNINNKARQFRIHENFDPRINNRQFITVPTKNKKYKLAGNACKRRRRKSSNSRCNSSSSSSSEQCVRYRRPSNYSTCCGSFFGWLIPGLFSSAIVSGLTLFGARQFGIFQGSQGKPGISRRGPRGLQGFQGLQGENNGVQGFQGPFGII